MKLTIQEQSKLAEQVILGLSILSKEQLRGAYDRVEPNQRNRKDIIDNANHLTMHAAMK